MFYPVFFLFSLALALPFTLWSTPAQVIIISQAETDPATNTLSTKGLERAGALGQYLFQSPSLLSFGPPTAIFATCANYPTLQTATPISASLASIIQCGFSANNLEALVHFILNHSDYNGKEVLIVWEAASFKSLISTFGFLPANPYPDTAYLLSFPATGGPVTRLPQELLYLDPTSPPLPY